MNCLTMGKVPWPSCWRISPSALVFKYSGGFGHNLEPVFKQGPRFLPAGSTPITRQSGFMALTAKQIPAAIPPPPTGTKMASKSGTLSSTFYLTFESVFQWSYLFKEFQGNRSLSGNDISVITGTDKNVSLFSCQFFSLPLSRVNVCPVTNHNFSSIPDYKNS